MLFLGLHFIVLFVSFLFKPALDCQDVKDNEKIACEIPADPGILVNHFVPHVRLQVGQLSPALIPVEEERNLGVEINSGARAAVAVD